MTNPTPRWHRVAMELARFAIVVIVLEAARRMFA